MRILYLVLLAKSIYITTVQSDFLETVLQWPLLDYALPDQQYLDRFRPENVVATGFEVSWQRIFVATPRLRAGVPATLSFIPLSAQLGGSPQLQAYPSWDWHGAGIGDLNCSKIISVYRMRSDSCGRLWVLDSGVMTSIDDFQVVCPPKLLVFDLQTNQLVRMITFPRQVLRPDSLFTNLAIDETTATTCDNVFVYMTDTTGPGIVVLDASSNRSWRAVHASMLPSPDFTTYQIGSDTFELWDGIVGFAFSPRQATIYYQPLATDRLFSVPTSALRSGPLPVGETLPVSLVGRKSSQGLGLAVDPRTDYIIFSPLTETAIAAWHPKLNNQRILAYNPENLQFVAEIRVVDRDNGNIWLLSSRFQKFFLRRVDTRDINIRIIRLRPDVMEPSPSVLHYPYHLQSPVHHRYYNNTLNY